MPDQMISLSSPEQGPGQDEQIASRGSMASLSDGEFDAEHRPGSPPWGEESEETLPTADEDEFHLHTRKSFADIMMIKLLSEALSPDFQRPGLQDCSSDGNFIDLMVTTNKETINISYSGCTVHEATDGTYTFSPSAFGDIQWEKIEDGPQGLTRLRPRQGFCQLRWKATPILEDENHMSDAHAIDQAEHEPYTSLAMTEATFHDSTGDAQLTSGHVTVVYSFRKIG